MIRLATATVLLCVVPGFADGPGDNLPSNIRRIPPPGIKIADADRKALAVEVQALSAGIEKLRGDTAKAHFLPDVEIYAKAVAWALEYDEFFDPKEVPLAKEVLKEGMQRLADLSKGETPWLGKPGLVPRGYRSKIDGSIQPYGLVVPTTYNPKSSTPYRLDVWCHGRGEKLSELSFLGQRRRNPGEFTPPNTIVLHLYGRYCCANKLAGEIDCFEAIDHLAKDYAIDPDRRVIRGFSMGGAACWQFAVHYPSFWCAAAPGAGFSETPEFLAVFQNEKVQPTWYEQKLWRMYDCPGYVINLANLPTVAYSGEIDKQKQAADIMAKAYAAEGMTLTHIIGPKTAHKYHEQSKGEINKRIDEYAEAGRPKLPLKLRFATYTLRYNTSYWLTIDALEEHWEQARFEGEIDPQGTITAQLKNIAAFTIRMPKGSCPFAPGAAVRLILNGEAVPVQAKKAQDGGFTCALVKGPQGWRERPGDAPLVGKVAGLQGPIDDAFLDAFLMVAPSGKPLSAKTGAWVTQELAHARTHWRQQYRGIAPLKKDTEITDADIAANNLILWGDPSSNAVLGRIADKLPVRWTDGKLTIGTESYDAATHAPILIYPNPLNPKKYVVLNSGFTFREYDYLNNARQVPKLPDWAIVDTTVPPDGRYPGKIVSANFFDERWQVKPAK